MEKKNFLFLVLLFLTFLPPTGFAENLKPGELPPELLEKIAASSGDDPYVIMLPTKELLNFDPTQGETGKIPYLLSQPAKVRIRIGIVGEPEAVIRTLIDQEERAAGENEELWDGRDSSGYPLDLKNCSIKIHLKTDEILPEYITDLYGESKSPTRKRHNKHNPAKCKELKAEIQSPSPDETVSGLVTFKVKLDNKNPGYSDKVGNGLRVYLDYNPPPIKEVFLKGSRVFTYKWDSTTVANGAHIVLVNICDHNDHVATASVRINVEN